MIPRLFGIALLLFGIPPVDAQFLTPERVDWSEVSKRQPEGLSLNLEVSKASYFRGEVIEATLTFKNASDVPYHLWVGNYDRSGRIPDIAIYAFDSKERQVADPLRWYFERGGMGGGLGNIQDLGEWKITIPANQWLRFDQPGTYSLRAFSDRVKKGDRFEQSNSPESRVSLVSNAVNITISALDPMQESHIIAESQAGISEGGKAAESAVTALRYLDTPASRSLLLPLIGSPQPFDALMGLYASANPSVEAASLLDAVRSGKLKFGPNIPQAYATLKTAGLRIFPVPTTREEQEALGKRFQSDFTAASEEITEAGKTATGGTGPDYNQALLTTLFQDPVKRPQIRSELVKVQLDLTLEQADKILRNWTDFGGDEFLPLVRKFVADPTYSPDALKALALLKPEEARPLIIEDLQRERPLYLVPKASSQIANAPLLTLPEEPIPELTVFFRDQLKVEHPNNLDLLTDSIARYGTPDLLPDVIKFYLPREGQWACSIQADVLKFWLRYESPGALGALRRALAAREDTRCYTSVLSSVLLEEWNEAALPIVVSCLDDPEPEVALSAIKVLEARSDISHLGPSLVVLQRISASATKENLPAYYASRGAAQLLLQSTRWALDDSQRLQLKVIVLGRPR